MPGWRLPSGFALVRSSSRPAPYPKRNPAEIQAQAKRRRLTDWSAPDVRIEASLWAVGWGEIVWECELVDSGRPVRRRG